MRKFIIPLLLASVAASPVMAADRSEREERRARASEDREERQKAREERKEQVREERQQASEPRQEPQQSSEPRQERQQASEPRHERQQIHIERVNTNRGDRTERVRERSNDGAAATQQIDRQRFQRRADQVAGQAASDVRQRVDARRQQWDEQRAERLARQAEIRNRRPPVISPTPQPGTQPPPPPTARPATHPQVSWSSNHWRKDRRYDWYKHRNKYWWLFQLGWYHDPFGWGYHPYGIGWRMWPSYYSRDYWLDDPWQYHLPYAPPGTRWIRYWDDAVLVDLWSGQVIDVVYNFFW